MYYVNTVLNLDQTSFFLQWAAVNEESYSWSKCVEYLTTEHTVLNETSVSTLSPHPAHKAQGTLGKAGGGGGDVRVRGWNVGDGAL